MGVADFPQTQDDNTQVTLRKKIIFLATIKNDSGTAATRIFFCYSNRTINSIKILKRKIWFNIRTTELCNYVCISIKLKAFCVTKVDTPKMVKNVRLYLKVVTFFCETHHT